MTKQSFDINKLRVASPCSVPWETMTGDEKSRHCRMCNLNVYNFSEMTETEVRSLVEKTEGRICGRLFQRADGTVITKDCPVGLRKFYKRTAQFAGAALTTVFALFSVSFGQKDSKNEKACTTSDMVIRVDSRNLNLVEGTITDQTCAVVPNAKVTLINEDTKREYEATTDENGYYSILLNAPGRYRHIVKFSGYRAHVKSVEINANESIQLNVSLEVGTMGDMIIFNEKISVDPKSSSNTFRITRKMLEKQP